MFRFFHRLQQFVRWALHLNIPLYAANACFFLVLSVFPMLLLVLGILRYTPLEAGTLTSLLADVMPDPFAEKAQQLILSTWDTVSGMALSVTAVTALWSAGRGIQGIITGLNAVYGVREDRGYLRKRLISMVYLLLFLLVLVPTLGLHVFGTELLELLGQMPVLRSLVDLRFFLLLFLQTGVFTTMFMVLPNRRNALRSSVPGGLLASAGWLIFSDLYAVYVEKFARLTNVYGSVYALALAMLWLYCCMIIVFWGGALNRFLTEDR